MGTELKSKMTDHQIKQSWGGDTRGICLQITASSPLKICDSMEKQMQEEGFIKITMEEAAALCNDLGKFVKTEARRRQKLLRDQLARLKLNEKSVFNEVAKLPEDLMSVPELTILLVSRFCPKTAKTGDRL